MKLMYQTKEKGKFILLLCAILVIEIFSNSSQTENVQQLESTINEIYSDRLIAQDLIYKMAERIHQQKTILLTTNDRDSINSALDQSAQKITGFINAYDKTVLTKEEATLFARFKMKVDELNRLTLNDTEEPLRYQQMKGEYRVQLDSLSVYLNSLANIQVSRSGDLNKDAHKIVSFSAIINELNYALLVVAGFAIAAIVFTPKSAVFKFSQPEHLN